MPSKRRPRLLLDDEGRDALVGPGGQRHDAGPLAVGHPGLGAVRRRTRRRRARPGRRCCGCRCRRRAPTATARRVGHRRPSTGSQRCFCSSVAVRQDQGRHHGVGVDDAGQAHPAIGQFLDDADVGQQVEAESAVVLGDGDAEETELAHLLDDLVRERCPSARARRRPGRPPAATKRADGLDDLAPELGIVRPRDGRASVGTAATARTIHSNPVDPESQFREECFPWRGPHAPRARVGGASRFRRSCRRAGGRRVLDLRRARPGLPTRFAAHLAATGRGGG